MTSQRNAITAGAAGAAGLATAGAWWFRGGAPEFTPDASFPNRLRVPGTDALYGVLDIAGAFTISSKGVTQEILPGKSAAMLAYEVVYQGKKLLNPLMRLRTGAKVNATLQNGLEEMSIIHWHGLKVDGKNDGHPHFAVAGGAKYEYNFTVPNRAATYWYHPHPHHLTGKQVYLGLGGLFIVEDEEELAMQKALDLALGATDIPLVLHDRRIDDQGQLVFKPTDDEKADVFLGSQVLVNWTPKPYFEAATRLYRFRVLNASNARVYKLAFRTEGGDQLLYFQLIGTDGGLIDRPRKISEVFLSPSERVDVLLYLRNAKVGDAITSVSVAFDAMEHEDGPPAGNKPADTPKAEKPAEQGGHAAHAAAASDAKAKADDKQPATTAEAKSDIPEIGEAQDLMRIHVRRKEPYTRTVPETLSRIMPINALCGTARVIKLDHVKMV